MRIRGKDGKRSAGSCLSKPIATIFEVLKEVTKYCTMDENIIKKAFDTQNLPKCVKTALTIR